MFAVKKKQMIEVEKRKGNVKENPFELCEGKIVLLSFFFLKYEIARWLRSYSGC